MVGPGQAGNSNPHLNSFHDFRRGAGETILAWVRATAGDGDWGEGVAALTNRRLCTHHASLAEGSCREVPVLGEVLRYAPVVDGESLLAQFETDGGPLSFIVEGEDERRHFGNFLGNLQAVREAMAHMEDAGLDPAFVPPPSDGAGEGVSAIYQLIRLKELLNQGILGELEFILERSMMIQRFIEQGAPMVSI